MSVESLTGPVPKGWELTTLGVVVERGGGRIQTGPFGSQLHASDYVPDGVPSIMPVNIGDNRIVEDGIARITEADAQRLARHRVKPGDIIYSRRGDVERRALVRAQQNGWLCGTGCLKVSLGDGVADPLFASYYLGHPAVRAWLVRHAVGATMPNLNTGIMDAIPFLLPPLATQRAIAGVLGVIDDKIENCRQAARTLSSLIRALFESWFIQFEHPSTGAASASLAKSPRGRVPGGWTLGAIGDLMEAVGGGTPSTKEPAYWNDGTHAFCTPKDMAGLTEPTIRRTERRVTDDGLAQISSGLLPAGTVIMSSRAPIGYLAIAEIPLAINQGIIAMKCKAGISPVWVLRWCESNMDRIKAAANGSTFMEISKQHFRPLPVVIPPADLMNEFAKLAEPMHRRVVTMVQQASALTALRELLLPKLISGEMAVPETTAAAGRGV